MGVSDLVAQAQDAGGGDVPWWVTVVVAPVVGVLVLALRKALLGEAKEPRTPTPPPSPPTTVTAAPLPLPTPPGAGASADEKMGYAQQLIDEVTASRDALRAELAESEALVARLQAHNAQLTIRLNQQDALIRDLQWALGQVRMPPGPPPGPTPTWTQPPPRTG